MILKSVNQLPKKEGEDIVIFAAGSMVKTALDVANNLENQKISTKVINMHTIKPIDNTAIDKFKKLN